ncbi:FIP1-like 1 protein [Aphelenchoides bicaudatus]|nr:FIP1-like 1 protein [Aphelenchoides bicaudatus]
MSNEAGFDCPAQLPTEAGIPNSVIKHEMNGEPIEDATLIDEDGLEAQVINNENGGNRDEGLGFLYEEDSSDDEAVVTIGDIRKTLPFQKNATSKDKIDLDGQPTINGNMIYDLDLATMEDKPWQKPGADITDYFNYGFNEETWNSYCERQRKLRAEYGTQKEVNRAIVSSISINFNPQQPQSQQNLNTSFQGGRQLINVVGPAKPQKMSFDTRQPPPIVSNLIPTESSNASIVDEEPVSPTLTSPAILPTFNAAIPPPNFDPSVPPPMFQRNVNIPQVNLNMPPPILKQQGPIYAGFSQQPQQFGGPQPLKDFNSHSFERRESGEKSHSGSDDEHRRRRKRRSRSGSPRRQVNFHMLFIIRKEEKVRDYRDSKRDSSNRGSSKYRGDREKRRDRDDDYDKDRKRRKYDRPERSSKSRYNEMSPDAPPGID